MIAIRAPEYFPGHAYIGLLLQVDRFYLADTFEYSRQSYHNRAKLRNPNGWQWITVPLGWGQSTAPLNEVEVQENPVWMQKHWRAIMYNYRSTPYFEYYEDRFRPFFENEWDILGEVTSSSIELVCRLLEIDTELIRLSRQSNPPQTFEAAWERVGDGELVSLEDTAEYNRQFVSDLRVLRFEELEYRQNFPGFEPGMSVLDMLFNYGPETVSLIRQGITVQ